jgi:hypothetical protein
MEQGDIPKRLGIASFSGTSISPPDDEAPSLPDEPEELEE